MQTPRPAGLRGPLGPGRYAVGQLGCQPSPALPGPDRPVALCIMLRACDADRLSDYYNIDSVYNCLFA